MKILLKCPTRSRPERVLATLARYVQYASRPEDLGVAISCDNDDTSMTDGIVQMRMVNILSKVSWHRIFYSDNHSKIEACNANMNEIEYPWDIVVLVSDDMIPQIQGYDDVIRRHMRSSFPDTNGILWFNDGYQGQELNTLCVYGRTMFNRLGRMYEPCYKSFFCDTELTDLCRTTYKAQTLYIPTVIIRHEHPATGHGNTDALYATNQRFFSTDMLTYISRKTYEYDLSILIPTLVGREASLESLLASLREKFARLSPDLRIEYCLDKDNRQASVGKKRQRLKKGARGKYLAFIDDDDAITDAYIEDVSATIRGNFHVMRLVGQMAAYKFVHSNEFNLTTMMCSPTDPPVFQRPPNHLNPMLADIAKFFSFQDATYGEDIDWTIRICRSGFLQTQYESDISRTQYIYNIPGRTVHPSTIDFQRKATLETMHPYLFTAAGSSPQPLPKPTDARDIPRLRLGSQGFVSR
jgi:hypothetical protein